MKAQIRRPLRHRISPSLIIALASILAAQPDAQAASIFDLSTAAYTQDFNSMGNVSGVNALPNGWGFNAATTFADALTDTTRGAGTTGTGVLSGSSGGGAYVFVNGVLATDTDKAIGFLTSGNYSDNRNILFGFTNNTGLTITSLSLSFDFEKYRSGTATRDWTFFASDSDTAWGTAIIDGGQSYASDASNTVISNPPLSQSKTVTIDGLSLAVGANYYFRWNYDGSGTGSSGQGLGIDSISFTASGGAAGRNLLWSPVTGAWNLTAQNWTEVSVPGVPTAFQASDRVTFDDSGLSAGATVTIDAAGVTIGATRVTNTTGTYTFLGGALSGSGSLTKSGAGKLVLAAENTHSGGTLVTEGTVSISADAQLGAASGNVNLGAAGTLETTGSLTLNSSRPVSGNGTISIAPSTTLNISGPASTGVLTLPTTGSLSFSGTASPQVGGFDIQDAVTLGSTLPITLGGSIITTNAAGTVNVTAALALGTAQRTFDIGDGSAAIDASISGNLTSGSSNGWLVKLGLGTLELLGDNSGLLGGVRLGTSGGAPVNGGTIVVTNAASLGPGGVGTAGSFKFNAGTLRANAPIQFPATLTLSLGGSGPLTNTFEGSDVEFLGAAQFFSSPAQNIFVTNSNVRFVSPLTGTTAGLTVRGTGSLTLAAGGTFVSDVTVDSGKLIVLGNLGGPEAVDNRPSITVIANGILSGSVSGSDGLGKPLALGSLTAGDLTTAGTISPGTSGDPTAVLTAFGTISPSRDALSVLATGILAMDIGGINLGDYDQIAATGTVNLAGMLNVSVLNSFAPSVGDTFTLIVNDGLDPVVGEFIRKAEGSEFSANGYFFRINYGAGDGNDLVLTTTVPEPGSAALVLGGLAMIATARRRRA